MNLSCTNRRTTLALVASARAVGLLKIDGCPPYGELPSDPPEHMCITSIWEVHGYDWKIRFYPCKKYGGGPYPHYMAIGLVFLSQPRANQVVTASLSCRLVDPSGVIEPSKERMGPSKSFRFPSDSSEIFPIMSTADAYSSGYFMSSSVTVECTITMFKDPGDIPIPSYGLQKDLGELLRSETGSDVTFIVGSESFAAHKNVLAARSPVFMAEFFGEMEEKTSWCVEIKEMEPMVFKAMLQFIYTDTVPELDHEKKETATTMGQHLLVAADRYGLDKLKVICECKMALNIDAGIVATTLALAEQHGCSRLKAKCLEFIIGGSAENLDAVAATDGFKSLESSSPSLLTELLKATHKRIKK